MSNTLKISRSVLAAFITVCLLLTLVPGGILRADGMKMYLFAKLQEEEGGTFSAEDAYWGESPEDVQEGKNDYTLLGAVYMGYESGDNLSISGDEPFCLNGAVAKYNGNYDPDLQFVLLGGTLIFNDVTLISKTGLVNGTGGNPTGLANTILERSQDVYDYKVESGKTFSITANSSNAGTIVETDKLVVNGTVNVADCTDDEKPNLLRILDNGTLTAGAGSITGSGNAILEICRGVKVSGGLKLYDSDGSELNLTNAFEATETFHWDSELNGWRKDGQGPQEPEGFAIYCDINDIATVSYQIGSGNVVSAKDDDVIAKEDYKDASSITFTVTLTDENRTVDYVAIEFGNDDNVLASGTFDKDHLSVTVSVKDGTFGEKNYFIDIRNQGHQDPEGWAIYCDTTDIASVAYQIGNGSVVNANDDAVIAKEDYKDASSITFTVALTDDNRTVHYRVYESGNDQVAIADGDFDKDNLSVTVSAGEGNATFGDKSYVIDIRNQGEGPNNDFEGIQVRYDLGRVSKVQYAIDNGEFKDVPEDKIIQKSEISNCTTIKFKAIPAEGEEDKDFILEYIDNPDFENEKNWVRTTIERDEGNDIVFTVNKSLIQSDKFVVDIVTVGGFNTNYQGINVGYDGARISKVQYSVDGGAYQDLPSDHLIPKDTVDSCTTSIKFKISPNANDENRNYVLDYVDGPDYSTSGNQWTWTRITHDEGENYIFTVEKGIITEDQFEINIFADDGAPFDGFEIQTKITAGRGTVEVKPESVIAGDGCIGDNHMRYSIAFDDYDDLSVVITPHADDVVTYMVKSISVSGIAENDYQIINNVLTLKNRPGENTTIVITVEFGFSDSAILADVAERGYAYTLTRTNYSTLEEIFSEYKDYLATELWNYYFDSGRLYGGKYSSKDDLSASLTYKEHGSVNTEIDGNLTDDENHYDIERYPWIDYTLTLDKDNPTAETTTIRVYVLKKLGFFIKTPKADNSGYDYYFAEYKPNDQGFAEDIVLVYDHDVGSAQIFGNGVDMEGVILTDSHDVFSGHVHQERTQLFNRDDANYISVRVVIVNIPNPLATTAVRVNSNQSCPGWEFDRMNIYTASANRANATDAYIYIGSTAVELDEVVFGNNSDINDTITAVELDSNYGLSSSVIKVTKSNGKFIVSFLDSNNKMTTNYDFIPLRLSIKDKNNQTTFKYLNLHRVALRIDKYDDAGSVNLKGTYYYPTLKSAPSANDKVDLYVTVTKRDGSKETAMIDGSSVQVERSNEQEDNPNFNPYYSEFTVWTGSESDFGQIVKVEVIVISRANNTDTHFGGVKVGYGNGVVWAKG